MISTTILKKLNNLTLLHLIVTEQAQGEAKWLFKPILHY